MSYTINFLEAETKNNTYTLLEDDLTWETESKR